ncbi:MAG: T9SS type A sorting domain-containing protein, partial [Winogradskyella sp.]|nr:T9SS type A sorting domain-containing protein [Winogradskyella sp.]
VVTINGVVADIDPPSTGAANSGAATTLTFSGTITGNYEPGVDGTLDIVFGQSYAGSSADWSNIVVELFEVPSCVEPTALMLDSVTATEAVVSWTNDPGATLGVEFEFGASGFTPGTGASIAAGGGLGSSATSGTTLSPNTDYDFYVRSNCDANGFSTWAGPVSFTTLCAAITPDYTADMSVNVPDACWDEAGSGDTTTGPMNLGASDWRQGTSYAFGASNAINLYFNNDQEWLLSPTFDLSVGGPYQLELNVAVTNWNNGTQDDTMGSDDEVQLLMSTDGGASWSNLTTWNAGNEPPVGGIDYVEDLTAITGNVQFALYATDGSVDDAEDYDFHVGKFRVRAIPSCPDPTSVMITSLTDTTVDFSWSMGGTETTWEYANLPSPSSEPASGTSTMNTFAGFTSLTGDTDYDFYVRSDCGGTYSSWVMISYTTPPTPPANDDFANATPIDCSSGTIMGSTSLATLDEDDAPDGGGADMDAPNVWFSIDSSVDGASDVTINLCGSSYDTSVLVYTGTSGNLTFVAANDDNTAACGQCCQSLVTFPTDGTSIYYIAVEGYNVGSVGDFEMVVSCVPATPAPANDECANAVPLTTGVTVSGTTVGATTSPGDAPTCDTFGSIADVWYSVEITGGTSDLSITTTITGTSDQANVALYDDCGALAANSLGCSDANGGETLDVFGLANGTYYVRVWSDGNAPPTAAGRVEGTFDIVVNATLSTGSFENEAAFTYYPNPVQNILTLNSQNTIENVAMYNMLGQEVLRATPNAVNSELDMSSLQDGTYFVKVTIDNNTKTIRIIKK